jgi:hypothetical protein
MAKESLSCEQIEACIAFTRLAAKGYYHGRAIKDDAGNALANQPFAVDPDIIKEEKNGLEK